MPLHDGKAILRNANETAKTIKSIKMVLNEEDWAKYLVYEDLEELRRDVVKQLVNLDVGFATIKKMYY
jgi:hypothetical protein